jgi:hypothetical protein
MRTLNPFVAVVSLALASLIVVGGAVLALFTFWPLLLLALTAGLAGLKARSVRQHNPPLNQGGREMARRPSNELRSIPAGPAPGKLQPTRARPSVGRGRSKSPH